MFCRYGLAWFDFKASEWKQLCMILMIIFFLGLIHSFKLEFACVCSLNHSTVSNSVAPWTVACQTPLSIGFSRQEYWSRLPFPTLNDLPNLLLHLLYW